MEIKIHVYGPLKEYFPKSMKMEIKDGVFTSEIVENLIVQNPAARSILNSSRIAIGDEIISEHQLLKEAYEISLLPPSSGG